jgi:hypothetical protein
VRPYNGNVANNDQPAEIIINGGATRLLLHRFYAAGIGSYNNNFFHFITKTITKTRNFSPSTYARSSVAFGRIAIGTTIAIASQFAIGSIDCYQVAPIEGNGNAGGRLILLIIIVITSTSAASETIGTCTGGFG